MKCFRCKNYDFDFKMPFQGAAYVECSHCYQGYFITSKLGLTPAEFIGDKTNDFITLWCKDCKATRFVNPIQTDVVNSSQFCNRCIDDARKLKESGEISYTYPVGEKMSWNDFLKNDQKS